jgi:hypothetical protein
MPLIGFKEQFVSKILDGTKKHTIRSPRKNPVKVGDTLILATGVRTKKYKEIKRVKCVSVHEIKIIAIDLVNYMTAEEVYTDIHDSLFHITVIVDMVELDQTEVFNLAKNDGFEDTQMFCEWFDKHHFITKQDFIGNLICWKNIKYKGVK